MVYNRQLEAFIAVAEAGSFSNAAKLLFVSQSALTQQINLLERTIGFKLFERSNRGVSLTPAGECFYRDILQIVKLSSEALERSRSIAGVGKKVLRIGCMSNPMSPLLFRVCPAFQKMFPDVEQRFVEFSMKSPVENLLNGIYDIIELVMPCPEAREAGVVYKKLVEDKQYCIILPGHPLEGRSSLKLPDLFGYTICLPLAGTCKDTDALRTLILTQNYPIQIVEEEYDGTLLLRAALDKRLAIASGSFARSFSQYLVPLESGIASELCIAYRQGADQVVQKFVEVAALVFKQNRDNI